MPLIRSALILFVATTALATLLLGLVFFADVWREGPASALRYATLFGGQVMLVVGPACLVVLLLAWRGRLRPVLDGTIAIAVIGLALATFGWWQAESSDVEVRREFSGFAWFLYFAGMLAIVPAYVAALYALRRMGWLQPLSPPAPAP